jgi:hypothetical protein
MNKILLFLFFCLLNINLSFAQIKDDDIIEKDFRDEILSDLYNYFLKEKFDFNFKDSSYLNFDITDNFGFDTNFPKINALVNAVDYVSKDNLIKLKCKNIIKFNQNFKFLKSITINVLNIKFDSIIVAKSLNQIYKLPKLDSNVSPALYNRKILIIALLKNYLSRTKELKSTLDVLKEGDQSTNDIKLAYKKLEKSYADYPYLITIIKNIQKNRNLYVPDDLIPFSIN